MTRTLALSTVALLIASSCVPDAEVTRAVDPPLPVVLADGRLALIAVAPIPSSVVASPESLRHYLEQTYWFPNTQAKIVLRQNLPDGFATELDLDPNHRREVHVVRQIGTHWRRCSAAVADSAMTAEVVSYCRRH